MDDLISRRMAIEQVLAGKLSDDSFVECVEECNSMIEWAVDVLKNLPSAQPEQRWIPCSERLPIGQTEVIASMHDDSGDTAFDYTASGWVTPDGEYWIVDGEINNFVVAWMPLPKPWKDEDNEL